MKQRTNTWDRDIEYWMVTMGSAIGFGCVWRFPFVLYNNGGAVFLIPYYTILFVFGIPEMLMETAIGQYFRVSLKHTYEMASVKWAGIAPMSVLTVFCLSVYYIYVLAYCVMYIGGCFIGLPFLTADERILLKETSNYYYQTILQVNPVRESLGGFNYPLLLAIMCSWTLVYFCVRKGVEQTGKIAFFTVIIPYGTLLILMVRTAFLPGSAKGLEYLFKPDLSRLFSFTIWKEAMVQVVFQLGLGGGANTTFASFRRASDKMVISSRLIPIFNSLTGLLASIVIFGYLGYFCDKYSLDIGHLEISGPGLVFITMPACLSTMIYPTFWILLFFCTLILIGIDSEFGLVETCACFVEDMHPHFRGKPIPPQMVKALVCLAGFLCGLPIATRGGIYVIDLLETFGFAIPASLVILTSIIVWGKPILTQSRRPNTRR